MRCLLVEDDATFRKVLCDSITRDLGAEVEVAQAGNLEDVMAILDQARFDLHVLDIAFPRSRRHAEKGKVDARAGVEVLQRLAEEEREGRTVVISSQEKEMAVKLLVNHQVHDYIFKDTPWKEIRTRLAAQLERLEAGRAADLVRRSMGPGGPTEIIGTSPALREALARAEKVAATDATVLVTGETGTGKELAARFLHERSARAGGAFVAVNCAALPESVIESELFGHVKGAFTGAIEDRLGRFELAHGGTLFLDEVGEIPLPLQAKLLRAIQEQVVERLGEARPRKVDVRLVSATNRDLEAGVAAGRFREDLFYRLNVFPLELPPLRERSGDVPALATHFLRRAARKYGRPTRDLAPGTRARLAAYAWPGNVRQLQNAIESAMVLETGELLASENLPNLPGEGRAPAPSAAPAPEAAPSPCEEPNDYREAVAAYERAFFTRRLRQHQGDTAAVAEAVGLPVRTLRDRLKKVGLDARDFRDS
jgi:DNA-binding NtrC family response regulator